MKKILLLGLLLVASGVFGSYSPYDYLEGKYVSFDTRKEINIKTHRDYLKIKGLPGHRGWNKFYLTRQGKWVDRHDNTISLSSRGRISYASDCGRYRIRYLKKSRRNDSYYRSERSSYGYERDRNYKESPYEYEGYQDSYSNTRNRNSSVAGRWYSSGLKAYVNIEESRHGLRARLETGDRWVEFDLIDDNIWKDERGNLYTLSSQNRLYWTSFNGRRKLELRRS